MIQTKALAEQELVNQFLQMPSPKVIIFGERHNQADRNRIERHIHRIHKEQGVTHLLSEEVGDQVLTTKSQMQSAIDREAYSTGPQSILLAMDLGVPVIGIDNWSPIGDLTTAQSFKRREAQMKKVIDAHVHAGVVCVILGDSHLRTIATPELGDKSVLSTAYKYAKNVVVVRSPVGEIK